MDPNEYEDIVRAEMYCDERAAMLRDDLSRAVEALNSAANALNRVAWGGDFTCFVDAEWTAVNIALDNVRATLASINDPR